MLKTQRTEIYTLDRSSPYPMRGNERRLRRRTIDLLSDPGVKTGARSWLKLVQKNKPQQKSIVGGLMVFLGAAIHIVWGHWRLEVLSSWKLRPNHVILQLTMGSWYFGCICGTLLAAVFIKTWTKKQLYYLGTSLLSLSGVMFIIWHDTFPALLAGRVLAGFCNGLVFLTLLIHATENIVNELRGYIVSCIGSARAISTFLATLLFIIPYYNPSAIAHPNDSSASIHVTFDVDLLLGIVTFVYAIIALLTIPYLTYETIPFIMQQGDARKALENLIRLRAEPTDTWAIRNEYDELHLMVQEDGRAIDQARWIFGQGNWRPLLVITAVRVLIFLTSNLTLQLIATMFVKIVLASHDHGLQYAMMVLLGVRIGFGFLPALFSDRWGRKWLLLVAGLLSGLCLIATGALLHLDDVDAVVVPHWLPAALVLATYLFISIGIDEMGNVLTAEAFPMAKKAWSIAFVIVIENVMHCVALFWVIFVRFDYAFLTWFIFLSGCSVVVLTLWLQWQLPETRGMSLRQCRNEFNKSLAMISYSGNRNKACSGEGITYS